MTSSRDAGLDERRPAAGPDRRAWRIAIGGVVAALLVLGIGFALERARFGSSEVTAVRRLAVEVQREFAEIAGRVRDAARASNVPPALLRQAGSDASAASRLFEIADRLTAPGPAGVDAWTVFDRSGSPVAWAGRPAALPDERVSGPAVLFVAPGPQGLRLVALDPIVDQDAPTGRLGAVAAEEVLTRHVPMRDGESDAFLWRSSLGPVALRPHYEGAGESTPPYGFVLTAPSGEALLEAHVDPVGLRRLRHAWRVRVHGVALGICALTLVLLALRVRDVQVRQVEGRRFIALTTTIAVLLIAARGLAALAVPSEWLLTPNGSTLQPWILRSPADALLTALLLLTLVALAGSVIERCRLSRRATLPGRGRGGWPGFWTVQVAAGLGVGVGLLIQEQCLAALAAGSNGPELQFSLHPFGLDRLAIGTAAILLAAAALWGAVLVLRAAATAWRVRRQHVALRLALAVTYAGVACLVIALSAAWRPIATLWPLLPAVVAVIAATGLARWVMPKYRRASQAWRLTAAYLALVLPSVALYPDLVAVSDQALERTIASEYAPEALTHRDELREQLRRSLEQLDDVPGLAEQFLTDAVPASAPQDPDRAFFLWSRTELGRQRLTSSVELYGPEGDLVSRFALNLPAEFLATERPVDTNCSWEVFGEALAATDDQVLLHAGRPVCEPLPGGGVRRVGVLVVHVVLDYGTLSFVTARDPYTAVLRPGRAGDPAHGREIEFAVYGWGRTPVYPTAGTAWPISTELLRRIYRADRRAFWETLSRGGREYRVLLSNDRAGIYAIGYPVRRAVDHAVALAEILTIAGTTFVALVVVLGVLSRTAGVRPATGRALLREIRESFYRKLFLLFVAASVVPVLALAFITRAYVAGQLREGLELAALRTASAARRVIETVVSEQRRGTDGLGGITDEILVSVSRIIDQDVNVFIGSRLAATSQRDLFASGLLPTRTPAEAAREITLERQSSYIGDERVGLLEYTIAAVPVRGGAGDAILSVPLTLRQQESEREIDDLDRRVTLAAVLFILLGAAIGYFTAERIADPVNRLTRATRRIARGDLDAGLQATSVDELSRLVEAFNQMADDLKRQRAELERTNRLAAWAEMARQVAHDIKNPLTPIQLSAEHLRRVHADEGAPLGHVLDECVDAILSQVRLLRQIASEFSSFASSPVARPTPLRLEDVLEEVIAPYRVGRPDAVRFDVQQDGPLPTLHLDRTLLSRALVNIIENALHAMRGGGVLTIRAAPQSGGVRIEIVDTGVGMDEQALARLFEPYFSTKATGTGLGLTIARRNIELNGGRITVTSQPGRGTMVTLELPERAPAAHDDGASDPTPSR